MKDLYLELRAQILAAATSVQHVRLWNNQVNLIDNNEQIPFPFPAVFIDFPTIEWIDRGKGTQGSRLLVRLHLIYESFHTSENEEDLAVFDFREEVYLAVQDYKPSFSGKLMRLQEETDTQHTNMYHWIMDFETEYSDNTAQFPRGGVDATVSTLVITKDVVIDSNTVDGVRTDKEII